MTMQERLGPYSALVAIEYQFDRRCRNCHTHAPEHRVTDVAVAIPPEWAFPESTEPPTDVPHSRQYGEQDDR